MAVSTFRYLDAEEIPQTFEKVDRDAIRARVERDVVALEPLIDTSVPQPASQMLDVFSSYQFNARLYQNNLRLGTFVRFAVDADLRERARERGIIPLVGEPNDTLRRRVQAAPYGSTATVAGLERAVFTQFAASVRSINFAYSAVTGTTTFTLLAAEGGQQANADLGTPTTAALNAVDSYLSGDAVSVLGGQDFVGQAPTLTKWFANITVSPFSSRIASAVAEALTAWQERTYALNNVVTEQILYGVFNTATALSGVSIRIDSLNTVGLSDTSSGDLASTPTSALLGVFEGANATIAVSA